MSFGILPAAQNRLLALLPERESLALRRVLEPIDLPRGFEIVAAGDAISYVYFLRSGIGSVVTILSDTQKAEAGMFGREGFSPTSAGVGATTCVHQVIMQVEGQALRMPVQALKATMAENPVFADLLIRYISAFSTQVAYTALCNVTLQVDERLARWLLMCHDRVEGDEIAITHDFISLMLGVRRPSVTTSLHVLEGLKMIKSERGRITIRDRKALEEFAGSAYGVPEEEYIRLFGYGGEAQVSS